MLFITLDTFSNTGGIQKVCKTLSYTLGELIISSSINPGSFRMLSLYDEEADTRYIKPSQFKGCAGYRINFIISAILTGIKSKTIIISHINLLPVAFCIKLLHKKAQIIMLAHGTEVWRKMDSWKKEMIQKHIKIWAVSKFTKQILVDRHRINSKNIVVLNNGLDPFFEIPDKFCKPLELLTRYKLSKDQFVLMSITRLSKHEVKKGYDEVIRLIPQLLNEFPTLHYLICGKSDNEEKNRLQLLISKENLQKHISLIDSLPDEELSQHYLLADTFILPSQKEGFGLVFIEAAACGCKVISGNTDGSTDAMINGKLGMMVNPESSSEIRNAIIRSLRQHHSHQNALEIQKTCLTYFSHQQYKQRVKDLLI